MIDLSTSYLGLYLSSPLVAGASPLTESITTIRQLEDAGAGAIVLHSLFEEQIDLESFDLGGQPRQAARSQVGAGAPFPDMTSYNLGPEGYLEQIRWARAAVGIPIIASLNGVSPGAWVRYARHIEAAGAHALELNLYEVPTDFDCTSAELEQRYLDLVASLRAQLQIPVAVKLTPFFTSFASFARRLDETGIEGLVLFNRFYQPDFNLETLEVEPRLRLSSSDELLLRLHWTAILYGHVNADLAITGGTHFGTDVVKAVLAGASATLLTSALLRHGPDHLSKVRAELVQWMQEHDYSSIRQLRGSVSLQNAPSSMAFHRASYMKMLRSYSLQG